MIDPLAAIISYLGSHADLNTLTAGRIAAKHKFGMGANDDSTLKGWETPSQAVQLSYSAGGTPDLYAGTSGIRLEARCYGASQEEASRVWNQIVAICDATPRTTTETGDGKALIYFLVPSDSPQLDRDPDVNVDMVRGFLLTSVAKDAVA